MSLNEFSITDYKPTDASELLRLLLELHTTHFSKTASKQFQELQKEKDIRNSYQKYIDLINESNDDRWKVLVANSAENKIIGFIIGSITKDEDFIRSSIGKFEDWFVEEEYRGKGIGFKLYNELEKWFIEKGCERIVSETWEGNELSIKAHQRLGFFVSGISLSKKLK